MKRQEERNLNCQNNMLFLHKEYVEASDYGDNGDDNAVVSDLTNQFDSVQSSPLP